MILLLMKALTRGDSLYLRYASGPLFMVADTIIYCHIKRPRTLSWCPKESADLKTIHDENDVLIDDELVVVRSIL